MGCESPRIPRTLRGAQVMDDSLSLSLPPGKKAFASSCMQQMLRYRDKWRSPVTIDGCMQAPGKLFGRRTSGELPEKIKPERFRQSCLSQSRLLTGVTDIRNVRQNCDGNNQFSLLYVSALMRERTRDNEIFRKG